MTMARQLTRLKARGITGERLVTSEITLVHIYELFLLVVMVLVKEKDRKLLLNYFLKILRFFFPGLEVLFSFAGLFVFLLFFFFFAYLYERAKYFDLQSTRLLTGPCFPT